MPLARAHKVEQVNSSKIEKAPILGLFCCYNIAPPRPRLSTTLVLVCNEYLLLSENQNVAFATRLKQRSHFITGVVFWFITKAFVANLHPLSLVCPQL
jgi:hypothetical protein